MSYYRAALCAARDGNLTDALMYATAAVMLEPEDSKIDKLILLCRSEKNGVGDTDCLPVIRSLIEKGKYRKALKISESMDECGLKYNIRGCLLAVMKRYRAASGMFAAALELDSGDRFAADALKAVAPKRGI